MRLAVIDIGTNTILLLIADRTDSGALHPVMDIQRIARIGRGVDVHRLIHSGAYDRCAAILTEYAQVAHDAGAERIIAIATSAVRDARDREHFLAAMHERTGVSIEVLSGEEEARCTYAGALSGDLPASPAHAVLDIGGGSTELALGVGGVVREACSLDIGCVRLTEQFLTTLPPRQHELDRLREHLHRTIARYPRFDPSTTLFIAVAGTATTLASIDLGLHRIDAPEIEGHVIPFARLQAIRTQLLSCSGMELQTHHGVDPGRADILHAGVEILVEVMESREVERVVVSGRGLRHGIALRG